MQATFLQHDILIALTNVTALAVPTYVITHVVPLVLPRNNCISAVHSKMAMHIMELVQYRWYQSLWYNQATLTGQKLAQTVFQPHKISMLAANQVPIPPQHWFAPLSISKLLKEA